MIILIISSMFVSANFTIIIFYIFTFMFIFVLKLILLTIINCFFSFFITFLFIFFFFKTVLNIICGCISGKKTSHEKIILLIKTVWTWTSSRIRQVQNSSEISGGTYFYPPFLVFVLFFIAILIIFTVKWLVIADG